MKSALIFCTALVWLVSCQKQSNTITEITVKKLAQDSSSWNGMPLPAYPQGTPEITILKITIPPHTKLKQHKHPVINAGVVLSGELTVISEHQDTLFLEAGDPIVELVDTWHYGENKGDDPLEIIVFYAGVKGKPITIAREGVSDH